MTVEVRDDPLVVILPEAMDTNETYRIVRDSDGDSYSLIYDTIQNKWCVVPF